MLEEFPGDSDTKKSGESRRIISNAFPVFIIIKTNSLKNFLSIVTLINLANPEEPFLIATQINLANQKEPILIGLPD